MQELQEMTQEQVSEWVRTHFQKANRHLAEKGVLFESVVTEESRYMAPFVAIWKIVAQGGKKYWVITGQVPTDFVALEAAKTAREAMKHFSLQWQLKAENIMQAGEVDQTSQDYANLLVNGAENIYALTEREDLWA